MKQSQLAQGNYISIDDNHIPSQKSNPQGGNYSSQDYSGYAQGSYSEIKHQEPISMDSNPLLSDIQGDLYTNARVGFIKKVYLILMIQIAITVGFCFMSYYIPGFLQFQIDALWLSILCFILMLVVEIIIFIAPIGRKAPFNLILLLIFTLCQAYFVSFICSIVAQESGGATVVVAAVLTLAIVAGLTAYAFFANITGRDFLIMFAIVVVIAFAMLIMAIVSLFTDLSNWAVNLYCSLGVIIFGIYLIIDTKMIVGGGRLSLRIDDYVVGALILYIDIIQIFLYILQILSKKK